jgi:hypothetical protein
VLHWTCCLSTASRGRGRWKERVDGLLPATISFVIFAKGLCRICVIKRRIVRHPMWFRTTPTRSWLGVRLISRSKVNIVVTADLVSLCQHVAEDGIVTAAQNTGLRIAQADCNRRVGRHMGRYSVCIAVDGAVALWRGWPAKSISEYMSWWPDKPWGCSAAAMAFAGSSQCPRVIEAGSEVRSPLGPTGIQADKWDTRDASRTVGRAFGRPSLLLRPR